MNKDKILRKSEDFTNIIKNNKSFKSKYYSIYYMKSEKNHYGITIPKKIGNAITRNKIKRQLKNIIYNNEKNIQLGYNYVIIIKEALVFLNYAEKERELLYIIRKVKWKNEKNSKSSTDDYMHFCINRMYKNIKKWR